MDGAVQQERVEAAAVDIDHSTTAAAPPTSYRCPITAFTGFLGAGKTTIILSLIQQLNAASSAASTSPQQSPIVWLKNEFGDTQTDSLLAQQNGIQTQQLTNGCVCCTATGQLHDTLTQLLDTYKPARILIETTGTSSPVALALSLKAFSAQQPAVRLDSIVCVVDVEQCSSSTADGGGSTGLGGGRAEVRYNDLVILNKCEAVTERQMEDVMEAVVGVTEGRVAIVKSDKGWVDAQLVLGARSAQPLELAAVEEGVTDDGGRHWAEVGVVGVASEAKEWREEELLQWLAGLRRDEVYRVKGPIHLISSDSSAPPQPPPSHADASLHSHPHPSRPPTRCDDASHSHDVDEHCTARAEAASPVFLLNWAYGRHTLTPLSSGVYSGGSRLTLMGHPSIEQARELNRIRRGLGLDENAKVYAASRQKGQL